MPPLQRRRRTGHCECTRARPRLGLLEVTKMRAFDMAVNFQANRWSGYLTRHRASPPLAGSNVQGASAGMELPNT